ncbi:hypothetical protein [Pseudomonas sp. Fl4BN1]|nr:hypothetical protein [Pseudomonas sp. Fl4BN1]
MPSTTDHKLAGRLNDFALALLVRSKHGTAPKVAAEEKRVSSMI